MSKELGFYTTVKKLNNIIYSLNSDKKDIKEKSRLKFLSGDVFEGVKQVAKLSAPFSKVAFVAKEESYLSLSPIIIEAVKEANCFFVGLTVKANRFETTSGIAEIFNLPEDVRLIITTDKFIAEKVTYYASVNNIAVLIIPTDGVAESYLRPEILIKTENGLDIVRLNPNKYVLLDENLIKADDLSGIYAHIVSKLVAIKDYVISCAINGKKPNKVCYTAIKNAVYHTINMVSENIEDNFKLLIENSFLIETVNNLTAGQTGSYSAEAVSALIAGNVGAPFYESEIKCAIKILEFYLLLVSDNKDENLLLADYNERAEALSEILKIPETAVLKGFLTQSELLLNGRKTAETIVKRLKSELKKETVAKNKILSKYYLLGGEDTVDNNTVNLAIKHSGDFPYGINLMSIVREKGFLEII